MSERQESQLDLKCFGILYTGSRQRELQSNETGPNWDAAEGGSRQRKL